LKVKGENRMSDSDLEEFMKKHPPWFMFNFHPIKFSKKISDEEKKGSQDSMIDIFDSKGV